MFKNRVVVSNEAARYKEAVGNLCLSQGVRPLSGDVSIRIMLYRPQRSGDLDNFLKVTLDAMIGHVYQDDKQVVYIEAFRFDDKNNPRVEVLVEEEG